MNLNQSKFLLLIWFCPLLWQCTGASAEERDYPTGKETPHEFGALLFQIIRDNDQVAFLKQALTEADINFALEHSTLEDRRKKNEQDNFNAALQRSKEQNWPATALENLREEGLQQGIMDWEEATLDMVQYKPQDVADYTGETGLCRMNIFFDFHDYKYRIEVEQCIKGANGWTIEREPKLEIIDYHPRNSIYQ